MRWRELTQQSYGLYNCPHHYAVTTLTDFEQMTRKHRTPKTLLQKLRDLDHHLYLLRENAHAIHSDPSHVKSLAAELRTLICYSSGTEGLLWRLCQALGVDDAVEIVAAYEVNRDSPTLNNLTLWTIPFGRPESLPPQFPVQRLSFREVIKEYEAIYVSSVAGTKITYEAIIKAVAEQIGSCHEDEGIDRKLSLLSALRINSQESYIPLLLRVTDYTLEIGERVLQHAEGSNSFCRASRAGSGGNASVAMRFSIREQLTHRVLVATCHCGRSGARLEFSLTPRSLLVAVLLNDRVIAEFVATPSMPWKIGESVVFAFMYSSAVRQAQLRVTACANSEPQACDIGWIDAREMAQPIVNSNSAHAITIHWMRLYERHITKDECEQLLRLSPSLSELLDKSVKVPGAFPD